MLGHIVCNQGLMVDPAKIAIIVNFPPLKSVKQLCTTLGHIGYYRKFIKGYAQIIAPMEKQLKKDIKFEWTLECQTHLGYFEGKDGNCPYLSIP